MNGKYPTDKIICFSHHQLDENLTHLISTDFLWRRCAERSSPADSCRTCHTAALGQEHHRSLICPNSILAQQHPTCSHSQTRDIRVLSSCYREIERPVTPKQEPPPRPSPFRRWPRSAWPAACFEARHSSTSPAPPAAATSRVRAWKQLTVPKEGIEEQLAAWPSAAVQGPTRWVCPALTAPGSGSWSSSN